MPEVNRFLKNTVLACALAAVAMCSTVLTSASKTDAATSTLKTVSNSDQTASVGLPDGWKLAKGSNGYIYATSPNDDRVNLGAIILAKNAPAGSPISGEVRFALPYSTSLKDKFTTIIQAGAQQQGAAVPQLTYAGQVPMRLPMCTRLLGSSTVNSQSRKFEAILCSLRPDYLGFYKNIVFIANIPSSRVSQDRALVEQIVKSYRITPAMFRKMLSSYTPIPPHPAPALMPAISGMAPYEDPTNSDCFDYNVIRESPPWEVPMHCGGTQPG
jgi:hypothetical protein